MPVKYVRKEVDRKPSHHNERWSEKQKKEAVALYRLTGNLRLTGDSLGIPNNTIKKWHISDWWRDYEIEIAKETKLRQSGKLSVIAEKALKIVEDRLDNGEWHVNKDGDVVRRPLPALTANKIASDTIDRQLLVEKFQKESEVRMTEEKLVDRLAKLHETFAELARKGRQKPLGEVFEAEVVSPHMVEDKNASERVLETETEQSEVGRAQDLR